jgi:predicted transcriptional regulator
MRRNGPQSTLPPPLELECLKALWEIEDGGAGDASVGDIRERLRSSRNLAYTTVMTLLDRLYRREMVTRRKRGRGYRYTAAITRAAMQQSAIRELVDGLFAGDAAQLASALGRDTVTVAAAPEPELDATLL